MSEPLTLQERLRLSLAEHHERLHALNHDYPTLCFQTHELLDEAKVPASSSDELRAALDVAALGDALYAALGWSTARYHPDRPHTGDDYATYDPIPQGIVSGDSDHTDWAALTARVATCYRAALSSKPAGHQFLPPPHADGLYQSSALCSCGQWQWDGESEFQARSAESILDWERHVREVALSDSSDPEAVGLDVAWAEAEAALPKGWPDAVLTLTRLSEVAYRARVDVGALVRYEAVSVESPTAALRALAARLTEAKPGSPA